VDTNKLRDWPTGVVSETPFVLSGKRGFVIFDHAAVGRMYKAGQMAKVEYRPALVSSAMIHCAPTGFREYSCAELHAAKLTDVIVGEAIQEFGVSKLSDRTRSNYAVLCKTSTKCEGPELPAWNKPSFEQVRNTFDHACSLALFTTLTQHCCCR
jgi:hypothetical protein